MTENQLVPGLRGPLTAREALNAILPSVRQVDTAFVLTFVGSQEGISPEGRAYGWDFFFEFPRRREHGVFFVHLCPTGDDDESPWCLDIKVRPLTRSQSRPALPLEFQDSAQAAISLSERGADFINGDSHMTLSTKVLAGGKIVWHTIIWDKEYQTPFA